MSLKEKEKQELENLRRELEQQLDQNILKQANSQLTNDSSAFLSQKKVIDELSLIEPMGRMVIPLRDIVLGETYDIELNDEDILDVPLTSPEVTVIGEVKRPISVLFDKELSWKSYLDKAGGFKNNSF